MMGVELVAYLFNDPKTLGCLPNADSVGRVGMSGEGPYMAIYLRLDQDVIRDARFETYGCPYAVACGSWVTQWVVGRTAAAARALEAADLELMLGGLPPGKEHCAGLAVGALRAALSGSA